MSSPPSTWKKIEARVAALFGTKRNPFSGTNGGISGSDSKHETLFIETKYRSRHALVSLYRDTEAKAKAENKIPIVALVEKRDSRTYLLIPAESGLLRALSEELRRYEQQSGKEQILHTEDA